MKKFLYWAGIVFASLCLFTAVFNIGTWQVFLAYLLVAVACAAPALWWRHCEKKDAYNQKMMAKMREDQAAYRQLLDPVQDRLILEGLDHDTEVEPVNRRWVVVAPVCIALAAAGVALVPAPADVAGGRITPDGEMYANCDEVREAGKAPLKEGEPGYHPALDIDGDGVACE